ncbi:DUF6732 family protein [Alisedimentitalea sp. MJ-SS2]|uniref:DUF6732 family protein n=1 Tax=Aliisedimentitalea sp. MJ-SS2 TaxID=3049795 RepID=UPI002911305C|nr:DUF6732 family protein [Alisedimentitalea sp. MJ-SS2]MDU8929518.1 DUF6732 family protein [Alisedimentitalea sp. MJ-SS2]
MRIFTPLTATALAALAPATMAQAHPGHLIEAAGHDHWLGAAAIGAAIAIGLWNATKTRKDKDAQADADDGAEDTETDIDAEPQEA